MSPSGNHAANGENKHQSVVSEGTDLLVQKKELDHGEEQPEAVDDLKQKGLPLFGLAPKAIK